MTRLAALNSIPVEFVDRHKLDKWTDNRPHQGLVLQAGPLQTPFATHFGPSTDTYDIIGTDLEAKTKLLCPLWVALDRIQDPQNMGAIMRTCAFYGLDGVLTSDLQQCPLTPTVSKASSGAMEHMNILSTSNLARFLRDSKANGWHIIGTHLSKQSETLGNHILDRPTILVVGNEGSGLRQSISKECDQHLVIPSNSDVPELDSLNVSVATAILIHHLTQF
ncbi:Alpha/beta knot methyltransferase [Gorgonomyces haynaldii]|nr:Alpha/beta knot methyltransferase [Gorgonomyces haynaldii]